MTQRPIRKEAPPIGQLDKFKGAWVELERPGEPRIFDVRIAMIEEVQQACDLKAFMESIKGKSEKEVVDAFAAFGEKVMKTVIELGNGKYTDDVRVMVEKVASLTGFSFPHRFQRYLELMLFTFGSDERWRIRESTTRRIEIQGFSSRIHTALEEAGYKDKKEPFKAFWMAAFKVATELTGDKLDIEIPHTLADGLGKFSEYEFSIKLVTD